jgi:uroporphyrinogen-III synthase
MSLGAVLVTRPSAEKDRLVEGLRARGVDVRAIPTVALEPLDFETPDLRAYDWAVVTSAAGASSLLAATAVAPGPRWAAVGPVTAAELERLGVRVDVVPERSRGLEVAGAMARVEPLAGRRVLLARATAASADLPSALRETGALVDELAVYRTVEGPESSRRALNEALAEPALGTVVFASGSAVRGLLKLAETDPRRLLAVTIGPATTAAAVEHGFRVAAESERASVEGLLEVIGRAA